MVSFFRRGNHSLKERPIRNFYSVCFLEWFTLAICVLFMIAKVFVGISEAYVIQQMIDLTLGGQISAIFDFMIYVILFIVIAIFVEYMEVTFSGRFSVQTLKKLRIYIAKQISGMPISYAERFDSGKVSSVITNNLQVVSNYLSSTFINLSRTLILSIGFAIYLLVLDWKLFLISISITPIILLITRIFKNSTQSLSKKEQEIVSKSNTIVLDSIRAREIVKSYNLENHWFKKYASYIDRALEKKIIFERRKSWMGAMNYFVDFIPMLICISYGGFLTSQGSMSAGELLAFLQILRRLTGFLGTLPEMIIDTYSMQGACQRLLEVVNQTKERTSGDRDLKETEDNLISASRLTFGYDAQIRLNELSLQIEKGEKIALVGESGSGKSTLAKLLCGFYDDYMGSLKVMGRDLKQWNLESLRSRVAYISQDAYLFSGTILENIACGKPDASLKDIMEACKLSNAHDFIMSLPEGYNTYLSESGNGLSGGQKQRICIARALLKDSDIIIMDESTSALDSENERQIFHNILTKLEGKSVIIISHRFSSITYVNSIFVLQNGHLVEKGSHEELILQRGVYYHLFEKQSIQLKRVIQ